MIYTTYTDEKVFADGSANIACNLVHQALINEFGEADVKAHFFLTGTSAKIIQGDAPAQVSVISFGANRDDIFGFCEKELSKLIGAQGGVLFDDQVQIPYSDTVYIEVFSIENSGPLIDVANIIMQDKTNIPTYIN